MRRRASRSGARSSSDAAGSFHHERAKSKVRWSSFVFIVGPRFLDLSKKVKRAARRKLARRSSSAAMQQCPGYAARWVTVWRTEFRPGLSAIKGRLPISCTL